LKTRILLGVLASVVIGVVITLISGLIQTPMTHLGVDVEYWGIPLSWITYVIPTRFRHIDWLNFIADLAFWAVIASVVIMTV